MPWDSQVDDTILSVCLFFPFQDHLFYQAFEQLANPRDSYFYSRLDFKGTGKGLSHGNPGLVLMMG